MNYHTGDKHIYTSFFRLAVRVNSLCWAELKVWSKSGVVVGQQIGAAKRCRAATALQAAARCIAAVALHAAAGRFQTVPLLHPPSRLLVSLLQHQETLLLFGFHSTTTIIKRKF